MELIELNADVRTATGNGPARVLRSAGRIPAVLYGPGIDPVTLSVDTKELEHIFRTTASGQTVLNLVIHDDETYSKSVMIKELQTHPTSEALLHADFYEIDLNKQVTVNVQVEIVGKSIGVENGGLLQVVRRELEVTCLPSQIPDTIEVDISELDVGDSLHVKAIPLPEGVEIVSESDFTVMTVVSPAMEIEEPEEEDLEGEVVEGEEAGDEAAGEDTDKSADSKES